MLLRMPISASRQRETGGSAEHYKPLSALSSAAGTTPENRAGPSERLGSLETHGSEPLYRGLDIGAGCVGDENLRRRLRGSEGTAQKRPDATRPDLGRPCSGLVR
jgi:hypothetical protein